MKWIGRILAALVVSGLLFLLGHFAWIYLLPRWVAICFYAYLVFGLALTLIGHVFTRSSLVNSTGFKELFVDSIWTAGTKLSFLLRLRNLAMLFVSFLEAA